MFINNNFMNNNSMTTIPVNFTLVFFTKAQVTYFNTLAALSQDPIFYIVIDIKAL